MRLRHCTTLYDTVVSKIAAHKNSIYKHVLHSIGANLQRFQTNVD